MKRILVPIDFSESSVHAFRFAVDIAARSKGSILLLHVIALPVLHDSAIAPVAGLQKPLIDELKAVANEKFARIIGEFNVNGHAINTDVVVSSHVHNTIIQNIKTSRADLVVMGTKGVSGIREWMIGSNTERIVRTSPVPVLAIKRYTPGYSIRNIVFPTALDVGHQEDLVMKIKALQDFFHAHLNIIWVNTPSVFKSDPDVRKKLMALTRQFILKDFTISVFNYTSEEAGILEFTREIKGDMIAMATHGFTGLSHLLAGSVAEDVVNHVDVPVWTYSNISRFR